MSSAVTTETEHAAPAKAETLYITDAELIRRMGVPEKIARTAIRELDRLGTGFPKKQKLWGDRRYWPAVKKWLDAQNGLTIEAPKTRSVA